MRTFKFLKSIPGFLLGLIIAAGLVTTAAVYAVDGDPPGLFQLDGDPQEVGFFGFTGDDWETLWGDCPQDPTDDESGFNPTICGNAEVFSGIIPDFFGTGAGSGNDPTTFTGGGSKDPEDISPDGITGKNWLYKTGTNQDKSEITNGFAAAYLVPEDVCYDANTDEQVLCAEDTDGDLTPVHAEDDLIIYFGADRFSNDGDAYMGFWFLQDKLSLTDISSQGGKLFDGVHTAGDILVLARFPQNSTGDPILEVSKWTGNPAGTLETLFFSENARCDGMGGKLACAVTNAELGFNPNPAQVWPYTAKNNINVDPNYPFETFVSGGINVTQLLEGADICISTFLVETRASKTFSETATLSDFVLGEFQLCAAEAVTKVFNKTREDALVVDGADPTNQLSIVVVDDVVYDTVRITGTALGGDAPDPEGDVTFNYYLNGTCVGEPESTSVGTLAGNSDGTAGAQSDDVTVDETGPHSFNASWDGDDNYPGGAISECEPFNVIQPLLTIRKEILSCDDDGGKFAVSVDDTDISALLGDPTVALLTDGDTEGPNGLAPDTYTVREVVQDDYVAVYEDVLTDCANTATGVQSITLAGTDDKTCTFLNVRKPRVTVIKEIDGTAGTFDLLVAGDKVNTTDPLQGSTLIHTLLVDNFGTPTVSEVATGDTSLADYSTIIQCDDGTSAAWDLTESPDERSVTLKTLQPGDHVTCTITNISPDLGKACLSD